VLNCTDVDPPAETAHNDIELIENSDSLDTDLDSTLLLEESPPHLTLADSFIGTTELTGNNDGLEVEQFLESVGLAKGNPYCAAFVSYILDETPGVEQPTTRSGLASHFIMANSIEAREVLRGTTSVPDGTLVIWQKGNTIFGHVGFVAEQSEQNLFTTIEANTRSGVYGNQRDGDGVWQRTRSIQPANYFRITNFTKVMYG
jgi:hypothetical protein